MAHGDRLNGVSSRIERYYKCGYTQTAEYARERLSKPALVSVVFYYICGTNAKPDMSEKAFETSKVLSNPCISND